MLDKFKKLFKKEDKNALERQAIYDKNKKALEELKKLKELLIYIIDHGSPTNRQQRKQMRRDFISNDKFGPELVQQTITFFEKRMKVLDELEKKQR